MKTIKVEFNKEDLPKWARRNPLVSDRAMNNYSFRCNVFNAEKKPIMQRVLIRETERLYEE